MKFFSLFTPFVRLLLVVAVSISLFAPALEARAQSKLPKGSVAVSAKNQAQFLDLGKEGKSSVLCRFQGLPDGGFAVGYRKNDKILKKKIWKSFKTNISEIKKNKSLTAKKRKNQIAAFTKLQDKWSLVCDAILNPTPTPTATTVPDSALARWNAGGSEYQDVAGQSWSNDLPGVVDSTFVFSVTATPAPAIANTNDPELYLKERHAPEIRYTLPLPVGSYEVVLHFAEIFHDQAGEREINVSLEGASVLSNYDIVADVGANAAVTKSYVVSVNDGELNITLSGSSSAPDTHAKISALQVRPQGGTIADDLYRLSAGAQGALYTDLQNFDWDDDAFYVFGGTRTYNLDQVDPSGSIDITGTDDDALFRTERYGLNMSYALGDSGAPLPSGTYEVSLYFAEIFFTEPGSRVFDVSIEGETVLNDYDIIADPLVGANNKAVIKKFQTWVGDGQLNIDFAREINNAKVSAVRVAPLNLEVEPSFHDFGNVGQGSTSAPFTVFLRNNSAQPISIQSVELDTAGDDEDFVLAPFAPTVLAPSAEAEVKVSFAPQSPGAKAVTLNIQTDDPSADAGLYSVRFAGSAPSIAFTSEILVDFTQLPLLKNPTSVQLGPDGRLYVAQLNGLIHILSLNPDHTFNPAGVQVVETIYNLPTLNANGSPATWWPTPPGQDPNPDQPPGQPVTGRQVTGIYVEFDQTLGQVVIYLAHSDPRFGRGDGFEVDINTHGGVLTRLIGPNFDTPQDLVIGLPRSLENHAPNSVMVKDGWVYTAIGGNTDWGGLSPAFGNFPETRQTASITRFNLGAIAQAPYDATEGSLETSVLPFKLPGVYEVYATGYRNVYDFVWHSNGQLYVNVNAPNGGSTGTVPEPLVCPQWNTTNFNAPDPEERVLDSLFAVEQGDFGGHPNPSQGHCVYDDGSLYTPAAPPEPNFSPAIYRYPNSISTNGIAEYSSLSAFGGEMFGDLITVATFDPNQVRRLKLAPDGLSVIEDSVIEDNANWGPLDVTVHPDGTIFAAGFFARQIRVLRPLIGTPGDYDGDTIPDAIDPDDDNDGYSDVDEVANGTNPFNPSSRPSDFDGDFISDLLDDDDDDDLRDDLVDAFIFDSSNGADTVFPIAFNWNPGDPALGKIRDTGFTGVMLRDGVPSLFPQLVSQGGAGGFLAIVPTDGTFVGAANNQDNALQIGVDASPAVSGGLGQFTVSTSLSNAFSLQAPQGAEASGIVLSVDDSPASYQDNYVSLALTGDADGSGTDGILFRIETDGVPVSIASVPVVVPGPLAIDLFLTVDPDLGTMSAWYRLDSALEADITLLGAVDLNSHPQIARFFDPELGAGLFATRAGAPNSLFSGLFDFFRVLSGAAKPSTGSVTASALFEAIPPTAGLGNPIREASTYNSSSFRVSNTSTGGQKITRVRVDVRSGVFADVVFDPDGLAGDDVQKVFTPDAGALTTGLLTHSLRSENNDGFEILDVMFAGTGAPQTFDPGEQFSFSIDLDPTSIRGSTQGGALSPGSISGLEMVGATVTAFFDDGSSYSNQLFVLPGSETAAETAIAANPPPAVSISAVGVSIVPATVSNASQTIRVSGPVGAEVTLMRLEGGLDLNGAPGSGFELEPFEANTALAVQEYTATVGAGGTVDIPVTLTAASPEQNVSPGLNHFIAVAKDLSGRTGPASNKIVLELE